MQVINVKRDTSEQIKDIWKWIIVAILLILGIAANYYFIRQPLPLRIAGWIVLSVLLLLMSLQTTQGKKIWKFYSEAKLELRKVVWPTRKETFQMTLMVIAMVVVLSVLLWGIDSILMWAISKLTG